MLLQSSSLSAFQPVRSTLGTTVPPKSAPATFAELEQRSSCNTVPLTSAAAMYTGSRNTTPFTVSSSLPQAYPTLQSSSFSAVPTTSAFNSFSLQPIGTMQHSMPWVPATSASNMLAPTASRDPFSTSMPLVPASNAWNTYDRLSTSRSTSLPTVPLATTDSVPIDRRDDLEPHGPHWSEFQDTRAMFEPVSIEKPVTKWKTATDFEGEFPLPQEFANTMQWQPRQAQSIYPGYHHTQGGPRRAETDPRYWSSLNEDPSSPMPFWVAAGTPAARMEPTWQDGNWYLVAPVDYKGLENMKKQGKWSPGMEYDALNSVDQAVRDLDAQGRLAPLPPPRHWKEHKSCPIA